MIVVMEEGASETEVQAVIDRLVAMEFSVHRSTGMVHTVLGGVGPEESVDPAEFKVLDGVKDCFRVMSPYKLASRHFRPGGTVVDCRGVAIGGGDVVVMAGPSLVESEEQIESAAAHVAASGARMIRAGVFGSRGTPYSPSGLGEAGLKLLRQAAGRHGLRVVCEITEVSQIPLCEEHADLVQVGARNMNHFELLRALGQVRRPVMLTRGLAATIEEWLVAAEFILAGGNYNVVLCERGIRTFDTRNMMDLAAIPAVKKLSHLPVVADPSQGTGRRDQAIPMARAAIAAGADGLLVEMHPDPDRARSEGAQSLNPEQFAEMMRQLRAIAAAVERGL